MQPAEYPGRQLRVTVLDELGRRTVAAERFRLERLDEEPTLAGVEDTLDQSHAFLPCKDGPFLRMPDRVLDARLRPRRRPSKLLRSTPVQAARAEAW